MLVLTIAKGRRLLIGGEITIKVVEIRGGKVRLGIEAPDGVRIIREELMESALEMAREREVEDHA